MLKQSCFLLLRSCSLSPEPSFPSLPVRGKQHSTEELPNLEMSAATEISIGQKVKISGNESVFKY